ncbi:13915_t:CDS:2, partial [Gigaspora rosea]
KTAENGTQRRLEPKAGLKLPKTLKDMLVKLMAKTHWDKERCAKFKRLEQSTL